MLSKEGNAKIYDNAGMRYYRILEIVSEPQTAVIVLRCESVVQSCLWEHLDNLLNEPCYKDATVKTRIVSERVVESLQACYKDVYIL